MQAKLSESVTGKFEMPSDLECLFLHNFMFFALICWYIFPITVIAQVAVPAINPRSLISSILVFSADYVIHYGQPSYVLLISNA